ncbi:SpoIIE family protein phosphatase [Streptomyces sp. NPDC058739]|uniref:SpoIIE family protein phosphatase n=1 Tax=Streptomyces sp. NPDC058739 TaxID=3346618 RepID=UPI0036AF08CE
MAFPFERGDTALLCTNDVIEARDEDRHGLPARGAGDRYGWQGPDSLLSQLRKDRIRHVGGHLRDDAATVAIELVSPCPDGV